MVNKNRRRMASAKVAASAYTKAAPQATTTTKPPAPRRSSGGFWLGFLLVILALMLMMGKTVMEYMASPAVAPHQGPQTAAFKRTQTYLETWRAAETLYAPRLPLYPHNPATGQEDGPAVVAFIDLGCLTCRADIRRLVALRDQYATQAYFVVKLLPDRNNPVASDAAIFAQVAQDHGQFWAFHDRVAASNEDTVAYYLKLLEDLGIPLRQVRTTLRQNQDSYLGHLRQDTQLAETLGLQGSTPLFIEGHRLGQPGLPTTAAATLLQRAIDGQPLVHLE